MTRATVRSFDNPVIAGFNPDPSVCRVENDYYLATSSFEYFPGIPIYHSRDLVHWRQIGNAIDRPGQLPLPDSLPPSKGFWAPTFRHHHGRFWIACSAVGAGGTFILTSDDPAGPWSDPIWLELPGIDPDLAWDDHGNCWCAVSGIQIARIDPEKGRVLDGPRPIWSGTGLQFPEAPHLYQIDDWWYLLIAEGGTERGHAVSIARSRPPQGPFEPCPTNPIVSHRSTNRPIQSTGHGDLVMAADGTWWMVLLATRPRGSTPGFHVLGRETFLGPVRWADGWPVVGPIEPQLPAPAAWHPWARRDDRDDFDAPDLAPGWISPRSRPAETWSLETRPGWLTLIATGDDLDRAPYTFVGRRQGSPDWQVSARLDPGSGRSGVSVRLDEAHHYDFEVSAGLASVVARIGPLRKVVEQRRVPSGGVTLVVGIRTGRVRRQMANVKGTDGNTAGATGPDTISFWIEGSEEEPIAELDGRYLSTEVATGFTGRVIGMYVTSGTAQFDWYEAGPR